jgi:diaminohydroxyphosphoribosylaminopyrimidine deaminase / 5-amino-6-(5-phosphoribosylamino)uracil reductase
MSQHAKFMQRCLQLALNGLGTTYPNPLVGSIIVNSKGIIIGEGWHYQSGKAHAEVNAINAVKDQSELATATLYVNLEPCSHFGKTPPCSNLIIEKKIPNVVIGCIDSYSEVAGKGIQKLKEAGVEVVLGILEQESLALNTRFFTYHNKKRPFIILKWAETRDGFIAPVENLGQPLWISNEFSRQLVHKWRAEEMAILVGKNTVLKDNPKLNTRDYQGNNPVRIVIDKKGDLNNSFHVKDNKVKTIFITENEKLKNSENCIYEFVIFGKDLVEKICDILYKHQIQSVIIEGGKKTLDLFIEANIWDEARVFVSETILNGGVLAPKISSKVTKTNKIKTDQLTTHYNYV